MYAANTLPYEKPSFDSDDPAINSFRNAYAISTTPQYDGLPQHPNWISDLQKAYASTQPLNQLQRVSYKSNTIDQLPLRGSLDSTSIMERFTPILKKKDVSKPLQKNYLN